jgi:2-polyprenyl-6-hydroxyphenyl methylase/3-demethylubiquinone-9 3-methyltransferase
VGRPDLTAVESHFAFGRNWESFSGLVDDERREAARQSLLGFLSPADLEGASFLDIGCGSGLFSLAALDLGCARLLAVDIDETSVATTRHQLATSAGNDDWECRQASIFDLAPETEGVFDIVYSWGVLHHTGDMTQAIARASALVAPGGMLLLALYRRTRLCPLWRWEKQRYAHGSALFRGLARSLYSSAFIAGLLATGRSPRRYFAEYRKKRGMDWSHDVEDWLGGYPYESITPSALCQSLATLGFTEVRSRTQAGGLGLFGSGCDEFLFRRVSS